MSNFVNNQNLEKVEILLQRIQRLEGKTEDLFRFTSKAHAMARVQEWVSVLRKEAMRGEPEEPVILILGSAGTEKEGIARTIYSGSRRGRGPWGVFNCAEFSGVKCEAELFGYEKGAFEGAVQRRAGTVELAEGGTIFVDKIEYLDSQLQAKFLKLIQEGKYHRVGGTTECQSSARFLVASDVSLEERVKEGKFREDLYQRLKKVSISIPCLTERKEDILPLAAQFAERAFSSQGKNFKGFDSAAESALLEYSWPGNVRELLYVCERAALVAAHSAQVGASSLFIPTAAPAFAGNGHKLHVVAPVTESYMEMKRQWGDTFERDYLSAALTRHGGNVSSAAREAKLDRSNFLRLLRRHGLKAQVFRKAA